MNKEFSALYNHKDGCVTIQNGRLKIEIETKPVYDPL